MKNPLLADSPLPYHAVAFDEVRNDHFLPAIEVALKEARALLSAIGESSEKPSFANTIESLEFNGERVDAISAIFSNLLHAETNEDLQELAKKILPMLAEYSNDIFLDEKLFARVRVVHAEGPSLGLDAERSRLLEKTFKAFVRNGALLDEGGKGRIREIDQRMASLSQEFSDHVLRATNAFELHLEAEADLSGLPESSREAAKITAKEKGKTGWVFLLQQPSLSPFLQFSDRRDLREKLWRASQARATSGEWDNRPLIQEIVRLRHERAKLLGYDTHAHFVLEERMASHPDQVNAFLKRLLETYRKAAEKDLEEVRALSGLGKELMPWDFAYWSEKLKERKFDFDEEAIRPYFKLENVVFGVFEHARRLYGLEFRRRTDLPVYHSDVQAFEVHDETNGAFVGLFYADFFPRVTKRGGAWMTLFKDQGMHARKLERPHVSIVCNLTRPTETRPSLLTLNEVRTIFHEFGHALHGLLSETTYRSLASPNVYWDFVELPSQIMENWVKEKEALDLFARHHETGEQIPEELVGKIRDSARFQSGWMALRQLNFAMLDMAWHARDLAEVTDVEGYERAAIAPATLFPPVPGSISSCAFSHIFAGGYSAGYYSYKWAEVLDADAFEFFQEQGIFSRDVSDRFRKHILAPGGTEHPMDLYKRFRGREPDAQALLRREGLIE